MQNWFNSVKNKLITFDLFCLLRLHSNLVVQKLVEEFLNVKQHCGQIVKVSFV